MSHEPQPLSREEIANSIRHAATSRKTEGPGDSFASSAADVSPVRDLHSVHIRAALRRAQSKTFVRLAKPFRRLFRNQGAVNDSVIEALDHLAAQNQAIMDQMEDLREAIGRLRAQSRRSTATASASEPKEAQEN